MRQYYTYILASKSRRLYIGVTNDIARRMFEHVTGSSIHTAHYRNTRLVYYETFRHPMAAINREKRLKRLLRARKIKLIEAANPAWDDLAAGWFDPPL
jgi:putative endonuclease